MVFLARWMIGSAGRHPYWRKSAATLCLEGFYNPVNQKLWNGSQGAFHGRSFHSNKLEISKQVLLTGITAYFTLPDTLRPSKYVIHCLQPCCVLWLPIWNGMRERRTAGRHLYWWCCIVAACSSRCSPTTPAQPELRATESRDALPHL